MKVLVIGSGGREHAIVKACLESSLVEAVVAAPGNGGISQEVPCFPLDVENVQEAVQLAKAQGTDFVVVGPEVPLSLGLVDALNDENILAYGPTKDGAELESSKTFTKAFLLKYNIPTAYGEKFTDIDSATDFLKKQSYPTVIKASGLAAGKGVIIPQNYEEAEATAKDMLLDNKFGESGHEILVEEFMEGEEASIMLMVSGEQFVQLPPSQDHKRVGEGDTGPNTGGMGAYAPASVVTPEVNEKVINEIIKPTLNGLKQEGIDYRGTLYIGIMISKGQPKVVEFNVRFGDPECQILLPLLEDDPISLMLDCAKGTLNPAEVKVSPEYAMIVVQAAAGYPDSYPKGDVISFPDSLPEDTSIVHAGTKKDENGNTVTSGGRVLGITAKAPTLKEAKDKAYRLCEQVHFEGVYYRKDIAYRQLARDGES